MPATAPTPERDALQFELTVTQGRAAPQRLSLSAPTAQAAERQAQQQGWLVLQVAPKAGQGGASASRASASRPTGADVLVFVEQLAALLAAGLSLTETLAALRAGARPAWAPVLGQMEQHLREGLSMSDALSAQPEFPPLLVALVRSAEWTSNLPQVLNRYLDHEQRAQAVRHQLRAMTVYPLLLSAVGGAVLVFLLLYVMPRFARIFEGMPTLPLAASLMVAWAQLLRDHAWQLLGLVAGLAGALAMAGGWLGRAMVRRALSQGWLAPRLRAYWLARWYRTLGMLAQGGIPLPEAMSLAAPVLPTVWQARAGQVDQRLRQGEAVSQAFSLAGMATPVAEQLIRAGERSGQLGEMLQRAAEFHEKEVLQWLDKAMRALEPVVMTVIGVAVGLVVVMMYVPVFELAAAIQ
jgi:general secretion pathway protein F